MENSILIEIENRLAALPVLEQRRNNLQGRINEAENDVRSLLQKFESETLDVEQIQKESFSNTLLKLIGKYEGKVNKETQEMLTAKMEYDKATERVKVLNLEQSELGNKLSELYKEKNTFEYELKNREEIIKSNVTAQTYKTYMELQKEQELLIRQLVETEEALKAANRVINTSNSAMQHLESAESWATYDAWTRGGIFSHMAKYDHIDEAQSDFSRLNSQVKDFEKELLDVNIQGTYESLGIDSTTRAIDFWFDNIFTDLSVRDKIRDDMKNLRNLCDRINRALNKLESNRVEVKKKLGETEVRKNDLIMSIGE
ncbi:MAG: hypothetical protein ACYDG2_22575 [Ruminiclostridium sp.]